VPVGLACTRFWCKWSYPICLGQDSRLIKALTTLLGGILSRSSLDHGLSDQIPHHLLLCVLNPFGFTESKKIPLLSPPPRDSSAILKN